jgi:hypothetical protein
MVLSFSRLEILSEISRDIGQVFFASVFLGPLLSEQSFWATSVSGLLFSITFWGVSLLLTREKL